MPISIQRCSSVLVHVIPRPGTGQPVRRRVLNLDSHFNLRGTALSRELLTPNILPPTLNREHRVRMGSPRWHRVFGQRSIRGIEQDP